ncbi:MAG: tRNA lysidine(34) synthetase TilS [Roseomonas sp.]|nr:tRNA lysidine(34) synthetase TilS [Roseomonas sp.]MCA3290203.1 tRNA lysidine(34) synthetase TilS [Roseomonas sp.]MCA3293193.1 tRNA lysidine(34) synthetase TilS [Roseomonas sp.]
MAPLGPFGAAPSLAVAVSGGPHSLAAALLARDWVAARGGSVLALVADHGLRPESGAEADHVMALLAKAGSAAECLRLALPGGARMQERARASRLAALIEAATRHGCPWLLLGHHRGDQAETLAFRALRGSGAAGLAAMAPLRVAPDCLILRPLLGFAPARLEAVVAAAGLAPVRDPSNENPRFARIRLRLALGDPGGEGEGVRALAEAAQAFAHRRARQEAALLARLATAAEIHPEAYALLDPKALGTDAPGVAALARLIGLIGGAAWPVPIEATAALLARGGGSLAGAWVRPGAAGRWLVARDPGLIAPAQPLQPPFLWDGRFMVTGPGRPGWSCAALGEAASGFRGLASIPLPALRALPALWDEKGKLAVLPGLFYAEGVEAAAWRMVFAPQGGGLPAG